jgi:hypothetical protein
MKTKFLIPLAGLAMLCACKGRGGASDSTDSTSAILRRDISVSSTGDSVKNSPKLVKTADIRFQVKNVRQTTEQITALTESYNGTVIHHFMQSAAGDSIDVRKSEDSVMRVTLINSSAEMTVKIPAANLANFMNQVARLGIQVINEKMDVTDKTLDYLSTRLKLKNQDELVDAQKKTTNKKDPDNLLAFKNSMVDQQIKNRKIDDSVKYSTVSLIFYENNGVSKRMIANNNLSDYRQPFSRGFATSFESGWNIFVEILIAISNFWVLIPIGGLVWAIVRYFRTKRLAKS